MAESEKAQKLAAARKKLKEFKQKQKTNKKLVENEKHSEVGESLSNSTHSSINGIYLGHESNEERGSPSSLSDKLELPHQNFDAYNNLNQAPENVKNEKEISHFDQYNIISFEKGVSPDVNSLFDEASNKQSSEDNNSKNHDEKELFIKTFHYDNEVTNFPAIKQDFPAIHPDFPGINSDFPATKAETSSSTEIKQEINVTSSSEVDNVEKKTFSNTESLKQLSSQINNLISESDHFVHVPSDQDHLERRNQELAAELQNVQMQRDKLKAQLEERDHRIRTLEAECEKSRIEFQTRINREVGPLQEQLQTHTQTLGILVAEKTELSTALTQSQLTVKQKITECEELQGRLRTSRCRVADLEKELNLARTEKAKLEQTLRSQDIEGQNKELGQLKEQMNETAHDLLEMKEKYNAKEEENRTLQGQLHEVAHQLSLTQLRLQQVTAGQQVQNDSRLELIVQEKIQLERQVKELSDSLKATANERDQASVQYQQYTEQLNEQVNNLATRLQGLTQENERLSNREQELVHHIGELEKRLQNLQDEHLKVLPSNNVPVIDSSQEIQALQSEKEKLSVNYQQLMEDKKLLEEEVHFHEEKERELEEQIEHLKENRPDLSKLMASIESDKVAAARATVQNTELKAQLEEMQQAFVKSSNDKMELMEKLMSVQHQNKEMQEKCEYLENQLNKLTNAINIKDQELLKERESLEAISKRLLQVDQVEDRLRHYEAQDTSFNFLQNELQQTKQQLQTLVAENQQLKDVIRATESNTGRPEARSSNDALTNSHVVAADDFNELNNAKVQIQSLLAENNQLKDTINEKITNETSESSITLMEQLKDQIARLEDRNKELELQIFRQNKDILTKQLNGENVVIESDNQTKGINEENNNAVDVPAPNEYTENFSLDKEQAMKFLEEKFLRTMQDVARLTEEKQRLEHLVTQLQGETETIGEYIALYQHQRAILHQRTLEKDEQLKKLQEDRTQVKFKLEQLNSLVKKLVEEKGPTMTSDFLQQQHQAHENNDHALCSEHAFIQEELNRIKQENMLDVLKAPREDDEESNKSITTNATAQQIIALLSEIKASSLVQSDSSENFHPCAWCSGQLITV